MEIQASRSNILEQGECVALFKRRAPNCKIKITIQEGRLQGYLKVKGESYTPVVLQGFPLDLKQRDVKKVRQFLERSYIKVHKGCMEVIQRGLGGGNNVSTPAKDKNVTTEKVIDVSILLEQISDQKQREVIRGVVNQVLNYSEGKLLRVQNVGIGSEGIQVLIAILEDNPSFQALNKLDLYTNQIGEFGARVLAGVLEKNLNLQQLNLDSNQIGDEGVQALAKALEKNQNLQQLDLSTNRIGDEGVKVLAKALEKNQMLQQLDLSWNQIGEEGAKVLAEALEKNQNLQQLNLCRNQIGITGVLALAGALKKNQMLQQLNLSYNQIGDSGALALAGALEKNQTLQQLGLSCNQIGEEGALALAEVLKKNLNLQQLHLFDNRIGDAGVKVLAEALEKNQNLQRLNLRRNQIGNVGALMLAGALEKNQVLQQLDLSGNQIDDEEPQIQITTLLQANRQIAAIFREQAENLETFIQSHQDQLITEEENFLSFQKEIERQNEKLETLKAFLEKITQESGRMSATEGYRKRLKDMQENLHDLLLRAFEDKLALLSQRHFSKEFSEERKITLSCALFEIWTFFFGFECPDWLTGKEQFLTTFCLLLSIAEGKEEASFDLPEMIFQRICQLNQPKP